MGHVLADGNGWGTLRERAAEQSQFELHSIEALEEMDEVDRPLRLESLEDVIQHVNFHEGQISAFWKEQHRFNDRTDLTTRACQSAMAAEMKEMRRDIGGIRKLIWMGMGAAAILGGIAGTILQLMLTRAGG